MKNKIKLLKKKFDLTAIAITYAEAGEWKTAENYLDKIERLNESKNPKMMVVALDSEFSSETIEYAVNLADRMHYDVLAVNAMPRSLGFSLFQRRKNTLLQKKAKEFFCSLAEKTQQYRIRCESIVILNDFRSQIKKLLSQIRQIEFVLVQVKKDQNFSLNLGVPVFQIITGNPQ
ncbi:hypothetical protein KJ966_18815 [bacterium]|nr:hypothetical protein [bacterium]